MVYDEELGKGVKKRYIPASQMVIFPANASFSLVIQKSREIFFPDETNESDDFFTLADLGGVPYDVENRLDTFRFCSGSKATTQQATYVCPVSTKGFDGKWQSVLC